MSTRRPTSLVRLHHQPRRPFSRPQNHGVAAPDGADSAHLRAPSRGRDHVRNAATQPSAAAATAEAECDGSSSPGGGVPADATVGGAGGGACGSCGARSRRCSARRSSGAGPCGSRRRQQEAAAARCANNAIFVGEGAAAASNPVSLFLWFQSSVLPRNFLLPAPCFKGSPANAFSLHSCSKAASRCPLSRWLSGSRSSRSRTRKRCPRPPGSRTRRPWRTGPRPGTRGARRTPSTAATGTSCAPMLRPNKETLRQRVLVVPLRCAPVASTAVLTAALPPSASAAALSLILVNAPMPYVPLL